jgi:hypothetical protein
VSLLFPHGRQQSASFQTVERGIERPMPNRSKIDISNPGFVRSTRK